MYRIRFHGRGGQGMKTASRILGTALFLAGFEVQDAPRYGAERRGAPIFAYVRADRKPINERGIISHPDLVAVADDSLVALPMAGVLQGITAPTLLLIHGNEAPETWQQRLNLANPVVSLPSSPPDQPAASHGRTARLAGAVARLVGVIHRQTLDEAIGRELAALDEDELSANRM
ncbi:MAG: 2-oxoacid:acceptor oxidoreductase family protein, partial [Desulfobulbaceae bacterium]|nr:2-oxoacid:acceptor oxidoreductase family protein [Desulfobulbaceae bacterium]